MAWKVTIATPTPAASTSLEATSVSACQDTADWIALTVLRLTNAQPERMRVILTQHVKTHRAAIIACVKMVLLVMDTIAHVRFIYFGFFLYKIRICQLIKIIQCLVKLYNLLSMSINSLF